MFPKTKTFKAVEVDKAAFQSYTTLTSPTNGKESKVSIPYNDRFTLNNMQGVRHSFLAGNMSLEAL